MSESGAGMGPHKGLVSGETRPAKPSVLERIRNKFPFLRTKKGVAIVVAVVLLIIGGGLAGLAALPQRGGGDSSDDEPITDDVFFYGQSPPVYPSRKLSSCLPRRLLPVHSLQIQPN